MVMVGRRQGGDWHIKLKQQAVGGQGSQCNSNTVASRQGDCCNTDGYQIVGDKRIGCTTAKVEQQGKEQNIHQQVNKKFIVCNRHLHTAALPGGHSYRSIDCQHQGNSTGGQPNGADQREIEQGNKLAEQGHNPD